MKSLRKSYEFKNVYNNGRSIADRYLVVYVWKNQTEDSYLGISCSKKIGNSVVRHHFARLIREIVRLHEQMFNSGLNIVVVARSASKDADYHTLEDSFLKLMAKAHLMQNNEQI
ncbi:MULTISPECIES: ribonuclease P protein component [Butyrivibrio]|jgi:ribonuclease P protein component|uniref:Ribonuclease P protein component n=1 Tax=Butyrivibrio fibrisolvens TaxID=831 RepID=A0A1H9KIL3_BUTFI|nr:MULTISPECIES: ribonuclease P protein component [Butyrivibrio]MCR5769777.1 ribonuclease P protein component [Butyrivibrio sp.]PWT26619.1 ribonuclease P protein component [Butyrivibrio fibrisolvens]SEQ51347.1 ribonuclease P protein component [Butyrivibrio sp. TB]SEQ98767.1 ribonuclease P protein component [Butyrivibrio fibrisolvens]